ncbi:L-threonylcarbamoyladenylate synthase [Streptomyces syringium]|uniref:L-threonylcarbamoyladenylate synthase n=1 Tax=Streptomyces syringium TaxID=76729 RepID=UPI0034070F33
MDILAPGDVGTAAQAMAAGHLVAVPTSRWYMLCARASDTRATAAIYAAKRRPARKPLLLVIGAPATARQLFDLTDDAHALIGGLWPGDLALRLPWFPGHPAPEAIGAPALVGCPDGVLGQLARRVGEPLAASAVSLSPPHASPADHPALTVADVAAFDTGQSARIAAVIDGGICRQGQHMTIVDCPANGPTAIRREGTVHTRAVHAALGGAHLAGGQHVG